MCDNKTEAAEDAHDDGGPRLEDVASGALAHHTSQGAVQRQQITPLLAHEQFVESEDGQARTTRAEDSVDDGHTDDMGVAIVGYR